MFSVRQKREIADKVQAILRATNHPELPEGEIRFHLHVDGAASWSWADIQNNSAVLVPEINPHPIGFGPRVIAGQAPRCSKIARTIGALKIMEALRAQDADAADCEKAVQRAYPKQLGQQDSR